MSKFYGYGIAVTKDMNPESVSKLVDLLKHAPRYGASCISDLIQYTKDNLELGIAVNEIPMEKCLEIIYSDGTSTDFETIAPVLEAVIHEAAGICVCASKDLYTGKEYLVFQPRYPWYLNDNERDMTPTSIHDIVMKYLSIISNAAPEFMEHEWDE